MPETLTPDQDIDEQEIEAFAGRIFEASLGGIEVLSIYVGLRLGLYQGLADGAVTIAELASQCNIHPRYAQEWLEQQTVAEIVTCEDRVAQANDRRYSLTANRATVLLDDDSPACSSPLALAMGGVARVLPELLVAYRTGGGVPYAHYRADFRDGQAGFNRPSFVHLLGSWLSDGLPEIDHRLRSATSARIADIACGTGWSSIALARTYDNATIAGFDVDDASIADARRNAASTDVAGRLRFEVRDALTLGTDFSQTFDLVTVFEAVHDMAQPVKALRACREMCASGGSVLVMDERAADSFAESEGPIERFLYGASVLHCLPVGMAEQPSVGTGTVMRADTLRRYATEAGFSRVDIPDIDHPLFRFYHLIP